MNRYGSSLAALLCAAVLASCGAFDKNAVQLEEITGPVPTARIKFFNFGVNAPGVNFYANTLKLTAISSTSGSESTSGVAYGAAGNGGFYSAIDPGSYTLSGKIAATVDKDLAITSNAATIANGKSYSYFLSGFYNTTTKMVEAFYVEDPLGATIDYTVAYVRFVHAISKIGRAHV